MLAETNVGAIILIALAVASLVLFAGTLFLRQRARGRRLEIPRALRPGPSDAALETPLLHRLQGWGVVLVAFFVVWFPIVWLVEPSRNLSQEEDLRAMSIARGAQAVLPFSEDNQLGVGCVRCHGPELKGGIIPFTNPATGQPGFAYPKNLTTICAGNNDPTHAAIASVDDIYQVIEEGRPDSGMPSWSIRFAGALDDQQINDIVLYLIDMSSKVVPYDQNICLNPDAEQAALARAQAAGTVLERP
jgi:mono/diheme cytochrome c family protein